MALDLLSREGSEIDVAVVCGGFFFLGNKDGLVNDRGLGRAKFFGGQGANVRSIFLGKT